jgi:hypothetical protein
MPKLSSLTTVKLDVTAVNDDQTHNSLLLRKVLLFKPEAEASGFTGARCIARALAASSRR